MSMSIFIVITEERNYLLCLSPGNTGKGSTVMPPATPETGGPVGYMVKLKGYISLGLSQQHLPSKHTWCI